MRLAPGSARNRGELWKGAMGDVQTYTVMYSAYHRRQIASYVLAASLHLADLKSSTRLGPHRPMHRL